MKKKRVITSASTSKGVTAKKQTEEKPKVTEVVEDDEYENSGFSKWMHTGEGVQFMKYFVVLNSLGVFLTLGWPSISKTFFIIRSFFFGDEE